MIPSSPDANDDMGELIDFNAAVLTDLLERVVAHRLAAEQTAEIIESEPVSQPYQQEKNRYGNKNSVLDLIEEVIPFAPFCHVTEDKEAPKPELSGAVRSQVRSFVAAVADGYNDVPFHNFAHASHVMVSVVHLLECVAADPSSSEQDAYSKHVTTFGISSDPLLHFAIAMAALIHDMGHVGLSNQQLIRLNTPEAIKYEGRSVAEQNSVLLSRQVILDSGLGEFRACLFGSDPNDMLRYRKFLVNAVLATDICDKELRAMRQQRWNKTMEQGLYPPPETPGWTKEDSDRRATVILEYLIQASDIVHTMQSWEMYTKFNRRLFRELYSKFVTGENDVDPRPDWFNGEIGFFDFYVIPLAQKLHDCRVFGERGEALLRCAKENRRVWGKKGSDFSESLVQEGQADFGFKEGEARPDVAKPAMAIATSSAA